MGEPRTLWVVEVGDYADGPGVTVAGEVYAPPCPACGHLEVRGATYRLRLADEGEARKAAARLYQSAQFVRDGDVWRVAESTAGQASASDTVRAGSSSAQT